MRSDTPYAALGKALKQYREARAETLDDLAANIEVDPSILEKVEAGASRPSEDMIFLLVNHFDLSDDEEVLLWNQAGYPIPESISFGDSGADSQGPQTMHIMVPSESRVIYTDLAHVMTSPMGVTINFVQNVGPGLPPMVVARVGMSREHAKSLIEVLKNSLDGTNNPPAGPKLLGPGK